MARQIAEQADVLPALADVFRDHGYEGASLKLIERYTGLGRGSLYHFFPQGKVAMAEAVLTQIGDWFERCIFQPLREADQADDALASMFDAVEAYFRSGQRVCLVGAMALSETREKFAVPVNAYFVTWVDVLTRRLARSGHKPKAARALAEDIVAGIQGALVLARGTGEGAVFTRQIERLRHRASA